MKAHWYFPGDVLAIFNVCFGDVADGSKDLEESLDNTLEYIGSPDELQDRFGKLTVENVEEIFYDRDPTDSAWYCVYLKNASTGEVLLDETDEMTEIINEYGEDSLGVDEDYDW